MSNEAKSAYVPFVIRVTLDPLKAAEAIRTGGDIRAAVLSMEFADVSERGAQ